MAYKLKSYTLTVKNAESEDKPNEDYFIADDSKGIYIVADGITSTPKRGEKYPNPSGGQLSAQIFCEEVYKHLLSQSKITVESAKRALRLANQEIFALNQKYNRYAEANFVDIDYFATVGSVVLVIGDKVLILHVGDTMVLLKRNSSLKLLTEVQTRSVSEYKREMRDSGTACSRELTIEIRKNFRNNISATGINGERVGYGAFTGEDGVKKQH
jgi:serine/threonine protein phosphatase PrpC